MLAESGSAGRTVIDHEGDVRVLLGVAEFPVRAKSRPPMSITSSPGL
jgi:hypothetical protein